jgi:NADH dehydrogenase FAD-containing subunit
VAGNIAARIRGADSSEFDFEGLGKLGSLGRFSAVAEILGIRVSRFTGVVSVAHHLSDEDAQPLP